jgi:hypothetical protein
VERPGDLNPATDEQIESFLRGLPAPSRADLLDAAYGDRTPWPFVALGVLALSAVTVLGLRLGLRAGLHAAPAGILVGGLAGLGVGWVFMRLGQRGLLIRYVRSRPCGWRISPCPGCGRSTPAEVRQCPRCDCAVSPGPGPAPRRHATDP